MLNSDCVLLAVEGGRGFNQMHFNSSGTAAATDVVLADITVSHSRQGVTGKS